MSVLTRVEAKSVRGRIFHAGVILALVIGGITMVYPFVLMLAGSMRSPMDSSDMGPVPAFLVDSRELAGKFAETKYGYNPEVMNRFRQTEVYTFRETHVPDPPAPRILADYKAFFLSRSVPDHWLYMGGTQIHSLITSPLYNEFLRRVRQRYGDDLNALNRDLGSPLGAWGQLSLPPPDWLRPGYTYDPSPVFEEYFALLRERPLADIAFQNLSGYYLERIVYVRYGRRDPTDMNAAYGTGIPSYAGFSLPRRVPGEDQPGFRQDWLDFVFENHLNLSFLRSDADDEEFQAFLREEFRTIENLKLYWPDLEADAWEGIPLPADDAWIPDFRRRSYALFLRRLEPERLRLVGPEFAWQDFLQDRYGTLETLNAEHGTAHRDWADAKMPLTEWETAYVAENSARLRREFASRNFRVVFNQVFVQGRPFLNTMIYVGLALLFSLTLQPMVAYALSRFNPPGTWKIIFLFVATMAFPPMVGLIPQFLIIQRLNLLNTFVALVMPVIINGYLIFLLKGFFDSIPQNLYDAAQIDGASELQMFRHITMALSYPILAVIALGTFNSAWMAFMYPLIVCPDERMHVLAVWLQQFQRQAPTGAVFASILVASIPSLIFFLFAQRTIMRGIAVPAEK